MKLSSLRCSLLCLALVSAWPLLAEPAPWFRRATIKPTLVRLAPGAQQRFKVVLIAARLMAATAPKTVNWAVNDIPGGNAEVGTIDSTGLYRAPAREAVPHEIHICAQAPEAANPRLWATVLMGEKDLGYKVTGGWSETFGVGGAQMKEPHGISVDNDGHLLITDQRGGRVFRYTKAGKLLAEIGRGLGSEDGQFTEPRFAVMNKDRNIYVSDVKGDRPRIQVFDVEGHFLRIFAEKGLEPGMILRAHGIAFDSLGRMFVTDVDNQRVSAFEPTTGKFLFCWGKDGRSQGDFNAPHGLFMDASNDLFVNGYYGPTQKFDSEGHYLLAFAHGDPPEGSVYFHSLAGDHWGNVYVTVRTKAGYGGALESNRGKKVSIAKYNNNGDFICNMSLSVPEHSESWAAVDDKGVIYALYKGKKASGVEIFTQQ